MHSSVLTSQTKVTEHIMVPVKIYTSCKTNDKEKQKNILIQVLKAEEKERVNDVGLGCLFMLKMNGKSLRVMN